MKKISVLCLLIVLILALPACALNKTAITAQDFSDHAESSGFIVEDVTEQMEGLTVVSLVAIDSTGSYQIEFHEMETQAQASGAFSNNSANFSQLGGGSYVSANGKNWASYAKTAGGSYSYVAYIETTLVYVQTTVDNKQSVIDFIKAMGY